MTDRTSIVTGPLGVCEEEVALRIGRFDRDAGVAGGAGVAVSSSDGEARTGDTVSDAARWNQVKGLFQAAVDPADAQAGTFAQRPAIE